MTVAVLIAGMHRSGTSATAGALNIAGVPLGEKLLPPTPANAKGYWENVEVVQIHDALLDKLGFAWDDVRPLPKGWETSAAAAAAKHSLGEWIVREFAQADLWAVKDPRLCRLLPLWLDVLRELAVEPVVLTVVRNPAEVAESLKARDGWLGGVGELLWLRHLSEAEAASRHLRRCAMTFEQLLASPVEALSNVASRLQLKLPRAPNAVARELEAFVDANERHQRAADGRKQVDPSGVASLNQQLYEAMTRVAEMNRGWDRVQRLAGAACERVDYQRYYLLALANGVARLRRAEAEARAERDLVAAQVESLRGELSTTRGERDAIAAKVDQLGRSVQAGANLIRGLRAELESIQHKLDASQRHLALVMQSRSWRLTAPLRWIRRAREGRALERTTVP
jgi:O-antigen biosynthesis protein